MYSDFIWKFKNRYMHSMLACIIFLCSHVMDSTSQSGCRAVVAKYASDICLGEQGNVFGAHIPWGNTYPCNTSHKRTGGNELLCESRRLSDRSQEQHLKNGKKSIRCYRCCDVTSIPKEPTWSLSLLCYM